jgi:autotransporter-associated beta strand protein
MAARWRSTAPTTIPSATCWPAAQPPARSAPTRLPLSGANTFTGTLQISAGTVQVNTVANDGTPNPLGTGGVTQLDGGTLRYGGSANGTSNHSLSLTANGGTLDSSPSAGGVQLVLNGTGGLQLPDPGSRTLTLTGADATPLLIATNQLSAVIGDYDTGGGLLTTINKTGNNRWQLNSANSYSGGTNITAGGMRINNASGFGTGLVTVANGAQAYINTGGTVPNNFTISGVGHDEAPGTEITGQFGSLRVANNGAVLTGTVTLAANARITGRGATHRRQHPGSDHRTIRPGIRQRRRRQQRPDHLQLPQRLDRQHHHQPRHAQGRRR